MVIIPAHPRNAIIASFVLGGNLEDVGHISYGDVKYASTSYAK